MESRLYNAAVDGDVDALKELKDQWFTQTTGTGNTVLHVIAQFHPDSSDSGSGCIMQDVVGEITELPLLVQTNSNSETALHFAARYGRFQAAFQIITRVRQLEDLESGGRSEVVVKEELLRKRNKSDGDTALHLALREPHPPATGQIVKLLLREDPSLVDLANDANESPLYLAFDVWQPFLAGEILNCCSDATAYSAYSGPKGRNALHAAAMCNFGGHHELWSKKKQTKGKKPTASELQVVGQMLDKNPNLSKQRDELGWTPLHVAARCNFVEMVTLLLKKDKSTAYMAAENDWGHTPLHVAVYANCKGAMKKILTQCPDSWEMVTSQGCNVLHLAIMYEQQEVFDMILEDYKWADKLIAQRDANGNTPLHLYASSGNFNGYKLVELPQANKNAYNKEYMTPLDVVNYSKLYSLREDKIKKELTRAGGSRGRSSIANRDKEQLSKREKRRLDLGKETPVDYQKIGDSQMIVAALIATIAFTAAFTIPGGFDGNEGQNQGKAILSRKTAFKAFIVADSLAMVFSVSAVFSQLAGFFTRSNLKTKKRRRKCRCFIMLAMPAMIVAYSTGLYAVLPHSSGIAIFVCIVPVLWYILQSLASLLTSLYWNLNQWVNS